MKRNIGKVDSIIRIVVGVAIIAVVGGILHSWWGAIGAIPLLTGAVRFCPLYLPFGVSTKK